MSYNLCGYEEYLYSFSINWLHFPAMRSEKEFNRSVQAVLLRSVTCLGGIGCLVSTGLVPVGPELLSSKPSSSKLGALTEVAQTLASGRRVHRQGERHRAVRGNFCCAHCAKCYYGYPPGTPKPTGSQP